MLAAVPGRGYLALGSRWCCENSMAAVIRSHKDTRCGDEGRKVRGRPDNRQADRREVEFSALCPIPRLEPELLGRVLQQHGRDPPWLKQPLPDRPLVLPHPAPPPWSPCLHFFTQHHRCPSPPAALLLAGASSLPSRCAASTETVLPPEEWRQGPGCGDRF
jgi:hypothetical protein